MSEKEREMLTVINVTFLFHINSLRILETPHNGSRTNRQWTVPVSVTTDCLISGRPTVPPEPQPPWVSEH